MSANNFDTIKQKTEKKSSKTNNSGNKHKKLSKKYNIDCFGNAVNLELKFKLNFEEDGGQIKIKKSKFKKNRVES